MQVKFKLEGAKALQDNLAELARRTQKQLTRKALREGAAVIRTEARNNTPVETGQLKKSVKTRAGKTRKDSVSVLVSTSKKAFAGDEYYGAFQEFGWTARDGRKVEGKHFLERAAETKGEEAAQAVTERLKELIEAEGAK